MSPPNENADPFAHTVQRGICAQCASPNVTHLMIGLPAGPAPVESTPSWMTWVGCVHPGHNRECLDCGFVWDSHPTEWHLQRALTTSWLAAQPVVLAGEPLFLTAWEVMSDYRINDAQRHWNQPSIDFLFLDRTGHLVALELKRRVQSQRDAWSVLCQVTHRAYLLGAGYEQSRLEAAYRDCWAGLDGRQIATSQIDDLRLAHGRAFRQEPLDQLPGAPVRRFVMADSFGPSFPRVLSRFTDAGHDEVAAELDQYRQGAEFKRYRALPARMNVVDPAPVQGVEVPRLNARGSRN